jgi:hypothetical protein
VIDPNHFRLYVVRPTLQHLDPVVPYSLAAENLLLGTALVESHLTYLRQVGGGPARGVFQIEPATHEDVWLSYLSYRPDLCQSVLDLASRRPRSGSVMQKARGIAVPGHEELEWNLAYACAIARLVYRRSPAPLPDADDVLGLAFLHKRVYNTVRGATVPAESSRWFAKVVKNGEYEAKQ